MWRQVLERPRQRLLAACVLSLALPAWPVPGSAVTRALAEVEELSRLSLDELAKVEVTSVTKSAQLLNTAAATVFVITRDDIYRSGVLSVPEALRFAPNLQVEQLSSTGYSITARGFGNRADVQAQANKLLILIDGRTVYSPLFSGVFYDSLDVLMDDVERIEVISGPGATLWGANAMNGVINIITRSAEQTSGALARMDVGNLEQAASLRYGSTAGQVDYRVYAKAFERGSLELADGSSANDRWDKAQGGFRTDWREGRNALTVQGDAYHADQSLLGFPQISISGVNALARWEHTTERSQVMLKAYYDRTEREAPIGGAGFDLDTYDIEFQQALKLGDANQLVWGAGKRVNNYRIVNVGPLQFLPPHRSLELGNVFVQDTIALASTVNLTAGIKFEDNPFSGWSTLPDLRLSWSPSETLLLWAAAARAIRAPTPFDVDVAEFAGPTLFLSGNPEFREETLTAYEVGYRGQPTQALSLSVSAFHHDYEHLRTVEPSPPPSFLPLLWSNLLEGSTYGVEAWANLQVTPWWRVSPGFRSLHKRLRFSAGASGLLGVDQAANDPTHQASLRSSMDFGRRVSFDAFLRHVGELPNPVNEDYYELSARFAWRLSNSIELAVIGNNLLHETHTEYAAPTGADITRSFLAEARVSF